MFVIPLLKKQKSRRSQFEASLGKMVVRNPPSQPIKTWAWWCVPVIPVTQEA
jgi:cytochrome c-type biogenesis protein CcmH/NrfF